LAVNPSDDGNSVAVWQQDRWSDGGANGLRAAVSHRDPSSGQVVWSDPVNQPTFTRCAGGSGPDTGWERGSDPWVAFSATGAHAYFMALTFNQGSPDLANGQSVSRSDNGGMDWGQPQRLIRDSSPNTLNDKNSLTADRFDDNYAYAIWDRLVFPNERTKGKIVRERGGVLRPDVVRAHDKRWPQLGAGAQDLGPGPGAPQLRPQRSVDRQPDRADLKR